MAKTRTVATWTDGVCVQRVDYGLSVEYVVYDQADNPRAFTKTMAVARAKAERITTGEKISQGGM